MLQEHPQLVICRPFVSQKSILHYAAGAEIGCSHVLQYMLVELNRDESFLEAKIEKATAVAQEQ